MRRTSPTNSSCKRIAVTPRPLLLSGYCCSRPAATVARSARACLIETSALSGPTAKKLCPVTTCGARRLRKPHICLGRELKPCR